MSVEIGCVAGAVLFLIVGYFSESVWHTNQIMDQWDTTDPFTTLIAIGIVIGWMAVAGVCIFLGAFFAQGIANLLYCDRRITKELTKNNGKLYDHTPQPAPTFAKAMAGKAAPFPPQDPKS